jgi:hypothetical protein
MKWAWQVSWMGKDENIQENFVRKTEENKTYGRTRRRWIYLRSYLLTYSLEQSPSCEANQLSGNQDIPQILEKPNVDSHIHKCPLTVAILSQFNPVHIPHNLLPEDLF